MGVQQRSQALLITLDLLLHGVQRQVRRRAGEIDFLTATLLVPVQQLAADWPQARLADAVTPTPLDLGEKPRLIGHSRPPRSGKHLRKVDRHGTGQLVFPLPVANRQGAESQGIAMQRRAASRCQRHAGLTQLVSTSQRQALPQVVK